MGLGKQRLLYGLGGNADDFVRAQLFADIQCLHVALAHVDPIGIHGQGDVHIVIDQERDAALSAQSLELFCLLQEGPFFQLLFPELDHGHAPVQALLHHLPEAPALQPVPVRYGIQEQILFIAVHTLRPLPGSCHPCCRWHR